MNVGEEWTESVWEIRVMKALLMSFSERKGRVKTWQRSGSDKAVMPVTTSLLGLP